MKKHIDDFNEFSVNESREGLYLDAVPSNRGFCFGCFVGDDIMFCTFNEKEAAEWLADTTEEMLSSARRRASIESIAVRPITMENLTKVLGPAAVNRFLRSRS